MCGILGYSHIAEDLPAGVLTAALEAIAHRGPDHQGTFCSEHISLGATRLRIVDLEGGDQPLFSPDRDIVVVFNGEIFNCSELRTQLQAEGFVFETRCDTEVVLHAFRCWGRSCFSRLRGMFAIALWVQSEHRLVLARDRMGIKPLYYCLRDGEIYFGSELKCILLHPAVRRNICLSGLNCFLSLNYVPGPLTLVEGIIKLMPGHSLEWRDGTWSSGSYLPQPSAASAPRSVAEACDELDDLLTQSLKEQLVSDMPVGIWLSGGLDSSTILHYAANAHPGPLQTYSVTFRGRSFDESRYIGEVSRHFGTRHSEFDLSASADLVDAIERIAYHSDEPGADAGALPLWFLAQMTSREVTVVLTGEGADELFAGYLTYGADRYNALARRIPARLRRAASALAMHLPVSDEKIGFEYRLKRFLQGTLLTPEMAHVFWNGTFSEAEKQRLFLFADAGPLANVLAEMDAGGGLQRYLDFDQRYYLPDDILYKVDRISMAHSLEVRPPFLDPRIVAFAAGLPERLKLRGSNSKYVLRRLMKDKLPRTVLQRAKIGFDVPIHEWLRGVLRPLLLDTLSREAVLASGLFHWPAVKRLVNAHLERKANYGYHLWGLMVLLIWMKRWKIELVSEEAGPTIPIVEVLDRAGL
ncbi:MAG TPA: asparagine synthase (glutamine-hydrolyzing) [Terriglobales bacterium]|jgi:asparagine synthase (glutamine-hydrolysing)|nr:asparagine synthase (glutamine-hydrolyzing) [Terriglobales bacterium]